MRSERACVCERERVGEEERKGPYTNQLRLVVHPTVDGHL